jgi:microcystin-dependent protein
MGVQIDGQNSTITSSGSGILNVRITELPIVQNLHVSGISTFLGVINIGTAGSIFTPSSNVIEISSPGSIVLPSGTTAQRPGSAASGMLRFNTDLDVYEGYRLSGWEPMGPPIGSIHWMAGSTVPSGYLKANGANVSRTTYARLFSVIGTTYGIGDGSTTFALPDLRGEFVRSWDDGRGVDSGRAIGTAQAGSIEGHDHPLSTVNAPHTHTASTAAANAPHGHNASSGAVLTTHSHTASSDTVNAPHAHTASTAAANAPHGHNASSGAVNAPHAHPGTGAANAPHGHNASTGGANAPHAHTYQVASGSVEFGTRNQNARGLGLTATGTAAANAPHAHPVAVAANNAPHSHPVAAGNAPHSHPVAVVANNAPHSHTVTVDAGNAPHSHVITVDSADAPHSHPVTIVANNAPHSHTVTVDSGDAPHTHTVGSTGGTETRPRNISLMAVIKY